ncbi:hypothetical protein LV779_32505 [Streptomyces thinghirensis]|nr:hypothetical protein [Streptomyces thinghirensis]
MRADSFTTRRITFAGDWLRADHPGFTGTQAVAIKVQGGRSAFPTAASSAHQDTPLRRPARDLRLFARQLHAHCYASRATSRLRLRPGGRLVAPGLPPPTLGPQSPTRPTASVALSTVNAARTAT